MYEQIAQIRILLAQVNNNIQSLLHERELYLQKYDSLVKENGELKKRLEELTKKE